MTRNVRFSFALAAMALALQACSVTLPAMPTSARAGSSANTNAASGATTGGTTTATGAGQVVSGKAGGDVGGARPPVDMPMPAPAASTAPAAAAAGMDANGASIVTNSGGVTSQPAMTPPPSQSQVSLKAGAIDDNAKFQDYLDYEHNYKGVPVRPYDVSERHVIVVKDANGLPVANTRVTVSAGDNVVFTGKTYANGQLLFHPKAVSGADVGSRFFVTVGDDTSTSTGFSRTTEGPWEIKLASAQDKPAPKVDLQIVLDTTGSMGGEIAKLQTTIKSISSRIQTLPQQPGVRFGLVAFKDQQDSEYLTKKKDFTGSVDDFQTFLDGLGASGGGDIPEDDETALSEALGSQSWDATAPIRLSFLITDAPTHLDYPQSTPYTSSIAKAQAMGVKFFTVGASGLPENGEYFLRQLAQATMGQYLFITRGGDEYQGGGEVSATVDKFTEGRLDDIMVDIVKGELNALNGQ